MESLSDRFDAITRRVREAEKRAGRAPGSVALVAVTKTHPFSSIEALYRLGQRDFGENYAQELLEKAKLADEAGLSEIRWHFIGHLQTNKVKVLLPVVHAIHSVDSERLASEISKRAERPVRVMIEVNLDEEATKTGVRPAELAELTKKIQTLPRLDVRGLMCIPAPGDDAQLSARFTELTSLARALLGANTETSMGMSDDFELAIACGSAYVRVGTALLGPRPVKPSAI